MSVLINMSMPENCRECRFGYDGKCFAEQPFHRFFVGDTHKCPLIELPTHGRLIDADALEKENKYFWNRDFINPKYSDTLADLINSAPTILEAEVEE